MSKETFLSFDREHIARAGSAELLEYLERSDFFSAPASTRFHGAYEGGLCEHSLNVFYELNELVKARPLPEWACRYDTNPICPNADFLETIAICGLLHDLCKIGFYTVSTRNVKNDQTGQWEKKPYYAVDDKLPYGHGEKSVFMIERYMRLTIEEAMAIRFHMGEYSDQNTSRAFEKNPLALFLHQADERATFLDEKEEDK